MHHTLGDGDFAHFAGMHESITCARAVLGVADATSEIDRVLRAVREHHRPGHLLIPADVAELPVAPPASPLSPAVLRSDPESLQGFTSAAAALLAGVASTQTCVLAGLLSHRLGAQSQLLSLLRAGGMPAAGTLWSKSLLSENDPQFRGTYVGAASDEATRSAVEDATVLILAGVQFTDLNSGGFSQQITRARTIELDADSARVGVAHFEKVYLADALAALASVVPPGGTPAPVRPGPGTAPAVAPSDHEPLSQDSLWRLVSGSLRAGDIVLADQGTSFYGMGTHRLPDEVTFVGQPLWASIGYTLPALLGVGLAAPGRRGVLLIGDGAAQMTVQELATISREGLEPLVIVVDNDGYTVERAIHGPDEPYNDIGKWDWTAAPAMFGLTDWTATKVATTGELSTALQELSGPTIIQVVVPADDVPPLLAALTRILGRSPGAEH